MNRSSPLTSPVENGNLKKELTVFVVLSVLFSWPVILLIIHRIPAEFKIGDFRDVEKFFGNLPMLFGLGPFISAISVTLFYRGKKGVTDLFKKVITWKVGIRWYIAALLAPVIPEWIGLLLWSEITDAVISIPDFTTYLSSWLQITFIATLYYITEELGWRGFMLSRIVLMHTWIRAGLIVGVIWSVWHYPIWLTSAWATTGSVSEAALIVGANTFFATGLSVVLTWIFKNTQGSVLLAMIFHGSNQANLIKLYAFAGDPALLSSGFAITQAITFTLTVVIILLVLRLKGQYGSKNRGM